MEFKNINCPECGLNIEYWTKNNFIECTKCNHKIVIDTEKRNLEREGIVYPQYVYDGEDEVLGYYTDDDGNKVTPEYLGNGIEGVYIGGEFVSKKDGREDVTFLLKEETVEKNEITEE